jgi:hypothetical protein
MKLDMEKRRVHFVLSREATCPKSGGRINAAMIIVSILQARSFADEVPRVRTI